MIIRAYMKSVITEQGFASTKIGLRYQRPLQVFPGPYTNIYRQSNLPSARLLLLENGAVISPLMLNSGRCLYN